MFKVVKRIFKNKKIEKKDILFDNSELHNNVSSYLTDTTYTIKDVLHINKKIREINKDENDINELKQFLIDNKDIKNNKKLVALVLELCKILKNREQIIKSNLEKSQRFIKFLSDNEIKCMEEFVELYERIISLNDYEKRIEILDNYICDNKTAINELNLLNEIELLLKDDINLEEIEKMNELEVKMISISEKLENTNKENEKIDSRKRSNLKRKYKQLQKQTKQMNKNLKLVKTA